jgi:hypothetical protein
MPTSGDGRLRRDGGARTLKLRNEANSPRSRDQRNIGVQMALLTINSWEITL